MREIKFNAVDEETGEYIVFNHFVNHNRVHNDEGHETLSRFLEFYYCFRLLQYTGLKDKNGVEIYEGDILKVANGSVNGEIMFQIYEVDYKLPYGFSKSLPLFCWDENGVYHGRWSHYCEVIGNIYENKEAII